MAGAVTITASSTIIHHHHQLLLDPRPLNGILGRPAFSLNSLTSVKVLFSEHVISPLNCCVRNLSGKAPVSLKKALMMSHGFCPVSLPVSILLFSHLADARALRWHLCRCVYPRCALPYAFAAFRLLPNAFTQFSPAYPANQPLTLYPLPTALFFSTLSAYSINISQ